MEVIKEIFFNQIGVKYVLMTRFTLAMGSTTSFWQ